jgi:Kef-type K+ transport system membrane component KefB
MFFEWLMVQSGSPFFTLMLLFMLAATLGTLGLILRQPMVVSFIAVGILSGPSVLNIVNEDQNIDTLAELGIAVLLFLVGLKLDLKLISTLGRVAVATGLGQVLFTSVFGFLIGIGLGFDMITSLYVAVALTFSSTIIIVKLLSDKKEADSLHGRIAIGFLIVQDLFVVLAMMVLSIFGIGAESGSGVWAQLLYVIVAAMVMLGMAWLFIQYAADRLMSQVAKSSELLLVFSVAWAAFLAVVAHEAGLSKELGGLVAGVSLASTPYRESIVSRLSSLRDFLLLFFFISLGSKLELSLLGNQLSAAMIFSAFVLIGNPLIVMIILGYMGYRKRTGFLAGLTVAQISEFSLIFIAMGVSIGHIHEDSLGLTTLVGLITIALSVYMITYSQALYRLFDPYLGIFERGHPSREESVSEQLPKDSRNYDVIVVGFGRFGSAIVNKLLQYNKRVLAIDFNPDVIRRKHPSGLKVLYGDACDQDFFSHLALDQVKWVISAMPQHDMGLTHEDPRIVLIQSLRSQGYNGHIAVTSHHDSEDELLRHKGADLIFKPFADAASEAVDRLGL